MPVLDTNFLIALKAAEPSALALLKSVEGEPLFVPSVVAAEYLTRFGADPGPALDELEASYLILHTTGPWIEEVARLRWSLQGRRKQVRNPDLWIAAWARLAKTAVITRNVKDFEGLGVSARQW